MHYSKILSMDIANSKGVSVTLFVSGCTNCCYHCHNPQTWDFKYGNMFTKEVMDKIIEALRKPYIDNFVISGGDPCHPNNIQTVINICKQVKTKTNKPIIIYTGYDIDKIKEIELFDYIDYLIDGRYIEGLKPEILDLRGSYNQRCYHMVNGKPIDISDEYFFTDDEGVEKV